MKVKGILSCLLVLLICSSCSASEAYDIDKIYNADKSYPAQSYWWDDYIKKEENRYYLLYNSRLYFWDQDTKSGSIVCSASNCSHDNQNCNAFLNYYGKQTYFGTLDLEIYNNRIYKIGYELDEVTDFYIYSMSMDGSERQKMGYLYSMELDSEGGFTWWYDWVMIDGYYYGALDFGNKEGVNGLYKIRVDGEKTLVYELEEKHNYHIDTVKGNGIYVYFTLEGYEDNDKNLYITYLMRYNTQNGEVERLTDNISMCDYCFVRDNQIIYSDVDGKCYLVDFTSNTTECVVETGMECMVISSDGVYFYIDVFDAVYVYDINGVYIERIPYEGVVLFGDKDYLFIVSSYEPGEESGNEEMESLWILDKSQLGNETKEWMKMELE